MTKPNAKQLKGHQDLCKSLSRKKNDIARDKLEEHIEEFLSRGGVIEILGNVLHSTPKARIEDNSYFG